MRKVILLTVLVTLLSVSKSIGSIATNDPVLLKINDREITVSEFEYVYTKNNLNPQVMDPRSIEEYLELFINFNLKVYEAMQLGLDTHASFKDELEGYRQQLAQPYLTDQSVTTHLLDEAYERMQHDLRASHILFAVEKHASPADTLAAWNKAMGVRERILKGESFEALAREFSDDPSAKGMPATPNRPAMPGNGGDLSYFTVLDMVYPFESAAYNLNIGEISMPVRTDFGYHLIKLTDKLPAMGRARVAHIMVMFPMDADAATLQQAEEKINEIYKKLVEEGEDFAVLAERFSDDKASGRRGGEMPAFTSNRMVPEFIKAISAMDSVNALSVPVKTQYGWHIIKFIEKTLPPREEALAELKNRISRDSRTQLTQQVVVERLKDEYGFSDFAYNLEPYFSLVDSTIFEGQWSNSRLANSRDVLFSFNKTDYLAKDFTQYLYSTQGARSPEPVRAYISRMYQNYQQKVIMEEEEKNLADKYPEFRRIMKEYHDGILLFELTDQKVWSKAMSDTTGLNKFFSDSIANYMWNDRLDAEIYTFDTPEAAKEGRKIIRKAHRKGLTYEQIMEMLNADSQVAVSGEKNNFEIQAHPVLENVKRKKGISEVVVQNDKAVVVWVNNYLPRQPKNLSEVRGLVIADYQNFLEAQWVKELRQKYEFVVNRDALNSLNSNK